MNIDADRLWRSIEDLAKVGAYTDEATGLVGVNRLALTDADRDGRDLVRGWFEDAGLDVRIDRIGNVFGRRSGDDDSLAPVLSGSHIDSVPTGGAFDGSLGVLGALEVIRTLEASGRRTKRPIEIAFFTDEEGARFGTDMLGSATACGRIDVADAYALVDRQGATVQGELARIGYLGDAPERVRPPHAYVEVHVEQGPVLGAAERDLGVVTGVQAISWQALTIRGKSAHAGTTPMSLRQDAGYAASRINIHLWEMIEAGKFGTEMRATMGRFDVSPNRINIVPSTVICTVDLRNPYDDLMAKSEQELATFVESLSQELGVEIASRQTARTASVQFDDRIVELVESKMAARDITHQRILSGAGHDAQEFAAICPTAMIFVPGLHDGISHNPREYSTPEACALGVDVLFETIVELADGA